MPIQSKTADKKDEVLAKGVHILSICDARSEKAQKIEGFMERIRVKFHELKQAGLKIEIKKIQAIIDGNDKAMEYFQNELQFIEQKIYELWEESQYHLKVLHKNFLLRQYVRENITTTAGRAVSARRLAGNTTYTGIVSHTALGTNNTAPAITDTQLGTETYRKALSSGTFANNISYIETFFTASEVSGTFQEYGNFIDGSGSANSGQIFNHFLQTITKSVTETLNVQSTITWSDA